MAKAMCCPRVRYESITPVPVRSRGIMPQPGEEGHVPNTVSRNHLSTAIRQINFCSRPPSSLLVRWSPMMNGSRASAGTMADNMGSSLAHDEATG